MATFKTEFRKYKVSKKKDSINIYLHGNKILTAIPNEIHGGYTITYCAPNCRWMNEHNIKIGKYFRDYEHLRTTLLYRLFTLLPKEETITVDYSYMLPCRFRTLKGRIYFEIAIYDIWHKVAVVGDHPFSAKNWTIKYYYTGNAYTHIGINQVDSTDKVINEFLNNIHIEYFPPKLKAWMEARVLARTMVATLTEQM